MTCDEYLAILAATPAEEIRRGRLPDHGSTCPHCERATRMVMERERQLVRLDDALYSRTPASVPPAAAVAARRHLVVERLYRLAVAITILGAVGFYVGKRLVVPAGDTAAPASVVSEYAFLIRCLSAQEAAAVARPLLGANGQITYTGETGRGVVTVRGTRSEIEQVTEAIALAQQQAMLGCTISSRSMGLP